jgi:uncharacterized repeat protein (TIGR04138 family)
VADLTDLVALARRHGTYDVEAYAFVGEGLRHASKHLGRDAAEGSDRHLDAPELVDGVLDLATARFGLLARQVLRSWGLRRSEDVGAITFHLIDDGIFGKRAEDSLDDFSDGVDFDTALLEKARTRVSRALS